MAIARGTFTFTAAAWGGATATLSAAKSGEMTELRMPNAGTAFTGTGGTTSFVITRTTDGGTVGVAANVRAPFQLEQGGAPFSDTLRVIVSQAAPSASGTLYYHYRR